MILTILIIIFYSIAFGIFSSYLAKEKNRDSLSWFLLGFFFGLVALLTLIGLPKLENVDDERY